ncbi:MAG: hypothetical protein KAI99_13185 [Cyclobacteriaceae bacterium]|nr:hypothetical protein [Cyclobacteriaceae bacterium]
MNKKIFFVLPFVLISLVFGILAGLFRMGWSIPMGEAAGEHGALMTGSFLGTLIVLERIVALKKKWMYIIPVISGMSLIFFILGEQAIAMSLLTLGSLGLIYIYIDLINRFGEYYFYVMMVGAIGWAVGNIIMIISPSYPQAAPWWIVFILLTVFGERLELSKFLPQSKRKRITMIIAISVFMVGIILPYHSVGKFISGTGLILIAIWLWNYDIARKSVKAKGMHRYTGSLLLAGYFWLLICGLLMIVDFGSIYNYDAMLHAFFLGFTFSMIFAHAPIIFPGVAGLTIRPFHDTLFIWAVLLQVTLAMRIISGLLMETQYRSLSGMLIAVIIILFFVNLVIVIISKQRKAA